MSHHIKTSDGYDVRVPNAGQVDYNTVAGSLGLASFLGLDASNILGGRRGAMGCHEDHLVNRYELGMEQKLAAKDSEIALLKANTYNDQKVLELYRYIDSKFAAVDAWKAEEMRAFLLSHNLPLEEKPFYNWWSLWLVVNMIYSDYAETIVEMIGDKSNEKVAVASYKMAVKKLKDKDRPYFVRDYFRMLL